VHKEIQENNVKVYVLSQRRVSLGVIVSLLVIGVCNTI
jgi:hypothetical protein